MTGYAILIPELLLIVAAAWALFAERLPAGDRGAARVGAALAALAGLLAALGPVGAELFGGALVFDGAARFARTGVALLAAVWLLWTAGRGEGRVREACALGLLTAVGSMLMASSRELITFVVSLELATMPAYVLMGYRKSRIDGLEGALKYFLLSMLTSLVMLYGISFLYGVTGSTRFAELDLSGAGALGLLAVLLTLVGIFAKLSAAPFHYWAPDAYAGAEPWSVAFVSTIPKIAGTAALVNLVRALAPTCPELGLVLIAGAVASMVLGNLAALTQTDIRRMMAYSGVAHAGYLMLGVASLSEAGYSAALLYVLAYAVPSMGIMLLVAEEGTGLEDFAGLSNRRPAVAWGVVVLLASLIGIPPLVGFFGKLSLFSAAVSAGLMPWVALAVVMSVVSAAYYLRIVRSAFFAADGEGRVAGPVSATATIAVAACVLAAIALGVAAGPLLAWMGVGAL